MGELRILVFVCKMGEFRVAWVDTHTHTHIYIDR